MGNKVFADYKVPETPNATGGPGLAWKIFTGVKEKTGEPRSVWYFDKKYLEKVKKPDQEKMIEVLKRDFSNLARLRHPLLLQVSKPLEDVGSALVVETEPIFASLANVLKNYKNLDKVPPALSKFHLEELEVKLGIIQLCEALVFAHSSAQMTHLNINPESIFLTADGTWKLGAFNWAQFSAYKDSGDQLFAYPEQDVTELIPTKPIIDYAAPEAVFLNRFDSAADMFSLGCVVFELFTGAPMLQCRGNSAAYKRQMQQLYPLSLDKIPATLQAPLEQLLVVDPSKRLSAANFLQSEFFSDLTIRVLHYISHILEKDDRSKADFFKGLLTALPQFELTVIERKILPILLAELSKNPILVPFLLPCIFSVIEMTGTQPDRYGKAFFQSRIFPSLLPLFTIKEPIQITLLLLQRVDLLVKGLDEKSVNDHIAALFCFALDHDSLDLKLAALKVGPPIFSSFNYDKLKNAILPRLEAILSSATINSAVRVGCLSCFSRMIPLFSRTIVEDQLLPIILRSSSVDRTAAVQMATVGVCDVISKKFGEEITAIKLLPLIIPTAVEPTLTKQQFDTFHEIITSMFERIATARRKILDEQQKLREKDEAQKKMEDFDRFHKFSQQLESPDVSVRTQQAAAAPRPTPAVSTPPVDARKADSFAELMENAEKRSRTAARESQPSILDMGFASGTTMSSSNNPPAAPAPAFSDPFAAPTTKPSQPESAGFSSLFSEIRPTAVAATDRPATLSPTLSFPTQDTAPVATVSFPSLDMKPNSSIAATTINAAFSLPPPSSSTAPTAALLSTNDTKKQPASALISQLSQLYSQPPPVAPVVAAAPPADDDDFFAAQIRPSGTAAPPTSTNLSNQPASASFEWGDPFASTAAPVQQQQPSSVAPAAARSPTFDFPF